MNPRGSDFFHLIARGLFGLVSLWKLWQLTKILTSFLSSVLDPKGAIFAPVSISGPPPGLD